LARLEVADEAAARKEVRARAEACRPFSDDEEDPNDQSVHAVSKIHGQ
jgi:hypothetical protein